MCRISSFFLSQKLKGSMSGDVHDFNIKTQAVIKFFFRARQGTEGNSCHSDRNIRGTCTVKNWVAQHKRDFSTCYTRCPGRPKTVTTPEINLLAPEFGI
jgi:hypothetical protein